MAVWMASSGQLVATALLLIPALYLAASVVASLAPSTRTRWRSGFVGAGLVLMLAFLVSLLSPFVASPPTRGVLAVQLSSVTLVIQLLVAFIGLVILRFARPYLEGDPCARRFVPALLFTLFAVSVVVITDHLGVLALAWSAVSLGLHRLLTLYPQRPAALMVAHKHFVASRLADISLVMAVLLIARETDTLLITTLAATASPSPTLSVAALLLAVTVIIRCAQLPLHGWLVQVMEAPTPVSALLHAGIVNLGGVVLLKMAWLIDGNTPAQWLLLLVGGTTALLATLAMVAQTSIKVRLAWSTSAQMGFMLVECAVGAWSLALLHLVGHSLYKAHAFLGSGDRVVRTRRALLFPAGTRRPAPMALIAPLALTLLVPVAWATGLTEQLGAAFWPVLLVAVSPLLGGLGRPEPVPPLRPLITTLAVLGLALLWHQLFAWITGGIDRDPASAWQSLFLALLFLSLMALQVLVLTRPTRLTGQLRRWFAAGLELDEWFTHFSLRFWPRQPPAPVEPDIEPAPWQHKETSA